MSAKSLSTLFVLMGLALAMAWHAEAASCSGPRTAKRSKQQPQPVPVEEDRITKACTECVDRDYSTAGMLRCAYVELLQREHEQEEVYGQLLDQLHQRFGDDVREAFISSQKRWEKFRDAQFKLIDKMYAKIDGTMYLPMRVSKKSSVVKQRTVEMRQTLGFLKLVSTRDEG